eukprot:6700176-Pyramimonas_sp.AAC.1
MASNPTDWASKMVFPLDLVGPQGIAVEVANSRGNIMLWGAGMKNMNVLEFKIGVHTFLYVPVPVPDYPILS